MSNNNVYPFETPSFQSLWWAHLSAKFDIPYRHHDVLVYRKSFLNGLLKLKEARLAGWNCAWSQDLTAERIQQLHDMSRAYGWDYFRMTWSTARHANQQFDALKSLGYEYASIPAPPQYVVTMPDGYEAYLAGLSHNSRKNLKKKVRKALPSEPQFDCVTKAEDVAPFMEEVFSYHIPYWTEKAGYSYYSDPKERQFTLAWTASLFESGHLVLERLRMKGETVNLSVGMRYGEVFYWLLTINTGRQADTAPGIVGLALRLEQLSLAGVTRVNMGTGDYFYKEQCANELETNQEIIVINPHSPKGRLYKHWMQYQENKKARGQSLAMKMR